MDKKEVEQIWLKHAIEQKDILDGRVKDGIEKYRKGNVKIRFCDKSGAPVKNKQVSIEQTKHAFKYGANIFMLDEFGDESLNSVYRETFSKYFNLATLPFYWGDLEPEKGKLRFDSDSPKIYRRPATELCMDYCNEKGIDAKLHCLVYEMILPKWAPVNDMKAMEEAYEKRISEIAEKYKGRLVEFEVLNELLREADWKNKSVISDKRDIIKWSFDLARKYLGDETLVINEASQLVNISREDYRNPYFMMVESALKDGVCIDKIGVQHHCFTGAATESDEEYEKEVLKGSNMFNPERILKGLDILAELGKPLEITEITVPTFGDSEEDEELQAELVDVLYSTLFSHPAVDMAVYWNVPDGYAYKPSHIVWDENKVHGGLFHKDMTPKKSGERLFELFNKRWHTSETLVTDNDGYVELRGFYGEYTAKIEDVQKEFILSKGEKEITIIL